MKCWTRGCKNEARKNNHYCGSCKVKKYRAKYPLKYIYDTIKMNAKRRRKEFTLTFNQFKEFCNKTGYDKFKGKTADSLSIDRKDTTKGYTFDNIQAITLRDNTIKRNEELPKIDENCPF